MFAVEDVAREDEVTAADAGNSGCCVWCGCSCRVSGRCGSGYADRGWQQGSITRCAIGGGGGLRTATVVDAFAYQVSSSLSSEAGMGRPAAPAGMVDRVRGSNASPSSDFMDACAGMTGGGDAGHASHGGAVSNADGDSEGYSGASLGAIAHSGPAHSKWAAA